MTGIKLQQGTAAWFEMVGTVMSEFATRAGVSSGGDVSLVERYTDGFELSEGRVQGIRFDITGGRAKFAVGVAPSDQADVTVEITAAAARELNSLHSDDPAYREARERFLHSGKMRVDGDITRLGAWLDAAHDPIVDRTK